MSFKDCENLTDNVLTKLFNSCNLFTKLEIVDCKNITEASLIKVGELHRLEHLRIAGFVNVPKVMFNVFRKLTIMQCMRCPSVTDEDIKKVLDNCEKLSGLDLRGTGITTEIISYASKRQSVFTILSMGVDEPVEGDYCRKNPDKLPYINLWYFASPF